jgi:hypothetical protein
MSDAPDATGAVLRAGIARIKEENRRLGKLPAQPRIDAAGRLDHRCRRTIL